VNYEQVRALPIRVGSQRRHFDASLLERIIADALPPVGPRPELSKSKTGRVLPLTGDLLDVIERAATHRRLDCLRVFHIDGQPIGSFRRRGRARALPPDRFRPEAAAPRA
jgi:hypothetical protein